MRAQTDGIEFVTYSTKDSYTLTGSDKGAEEPDYTKQDTPVLMHRKKANIEEDFFGLDAYKASRMNCETSRDESAYSRV